MIDHQFLDSGQRTHCVPLLLSTVTLMWVWSKYWILDRFCLSTGGYELLLTVSSVTMASAGVWRQAPTVSTVSKISTAQQWM